ncbi:MAG TPA: hypothetical protein VG345_09830 [Bryobacteraceae bacterium]|jgi:hypothetical protein|nr:hypothetical protein [Bryobacteraceae bacterium]
MKRKTPPRTEPVVAPEILAGARRPVDAGRQNPTARCVVCGAETSAEAAEQLCWVCRRLKISAWRDVEQQMPAQE